MIEAGLALGLLAVSLALAVAGWRLQSQLRRRLPDLFFRAEVLRSEALRLQRSQRQIADAQRLAETVVSGGTHTVRAIHRGIAAIPFGILEAIPATRDVTRIVRTSHDLISDAVYGSIQAVNRGVGHGLRAGLNAGLPPAAPDPGLGPPGSEPTALK
ncbi:hypothetical protein DFR24_0093 [Panacagrimonas perspica]|uniref:Uncharacterized protein n=1 Tax=Panacagrimonas perspica TaxID=381431 RepID=A0A4S3K0V7_9GAMM|nr:hypothetical protein [Panacagrimonas perspica]TDU30739.1 hypothetical protein DFR24_0093 [Panacagrimonas perspica]THD01562.1 hypothetical protein B1810_18775 [Panacagrimonas perspica]